MFTCLLGFSAICAEFSCLQVLPESNEVCFLKKVDKTSKMRFMLKSRLHLAAASLLLVALIVIIHQMLSGVDETTTMSEALHAGYSQHAFEVGF